LANLRPLVRTAACETSNWVDGRLAKLLGCSRRTLLRHSGTGALSQEAVDGAVKLPVVAVALLVLAGCVSADTDLTPMEQAIAEGSEIGVVSSLAMSAMASASSTAPVPCAQVTSGCTSFPCIGAVTLTLGASCPFPIGGAGSGTVAVTGTWSSATEATLGARFGTAQIGGAASVLTSFEGVAATVGQAEYSGQALQPASTALLSAQSLWTVMPSGIDGGFELNGSDGQAGRNSNTQLKLVGVIVGPPCTENPTAGSASLQFMSDLNTEQANVTFESACNGMASLGGGTEAALQFTSF
jgi:hypothetical protein